MKLQILFFKKKIVYYTLAIITFTIMLTFFLFFRKCSISTFNVVNENKMMQADLTADGNKDILYIKTDADKYYIQINSESKSYYLEPSKKSNTVGNYYSQWPMRLTLMDISRNNIPEIFTQASVKDEAIQHVFLWTGEKFDDIFCSTNNILGFIDSKNNKTPKVISGNIKDGEMNLVSYIFIKNNLKSFNYNYADNYMGKNTMLGFVNLMESFPLSELNMSKELFAPYLNGNDISLLGDLSSQKIHFTFQDAVFKDYNWDKDGNASEILWTLNFKGTNTNDLKETKNYTIDLIVKLMPNENKVSIFKISSVTLK
ncbi:VCBS repeat-containing protein [Clostridium sp. CM028]|uniref:VCBS repeat-containing protein n=1 Tax=unclassified Clostridium TaxID=2614128 RepID=UPI001C0C5E7E|nr:MULTISPECIES: VCBS repeat-containing protein [unclassified Clostridium]MBU3090855.1 VCBS repeat-containing protein [Clostridium sp. CF011]MBW9144578.1 VCBS repeat-containing protein [Clostridium sp. CM027]MBW9147896.1 VCBS repeat-containing protein [Clostridium sp. CM028]UVE40661.1 VCBS repeat-containing protein [Clostridium sp. CM027]WAG69628.1 VCBS repeat-containing protein [Clostridium sp. CF011]